MIKNVIYLTINSWCEIILCNSGSVDRKLKKINQKSTKNLLAVIIAEILIVRIIPNPEANDW